MKGEYVEEENDNNNQTNNTTPTNMFAKFSHNPNFQPPPPHHFPPPHFHSHHPPFPEESNSATTTPPSQPPHHHLSTKKLKTTPPSATTSNEDTGTIEVSRRPRGRPPGSKNKPKPPIIITREPEPAMSPYILELQSGADIVDSITRFTRRRGVGICILTASGAVANVSLKQPSTTTPGGTVTFRGRFDILSLSAVVLNSVPFHGGGGFTISLAGPQGQIVGGKVVGTLVCSGTVYVIAASFNNPTYCKLPLDDQDGQGQPPPPPSQLPQTHRSHSSNVQSDEPHENSPASDEIGGGSMTLYSGHLGTTTAATPSAAASSAASGEVIWATPSSSARPSY